MSTFSALCFSKPRFLFECNRLTLLAFLRSYESFFSGRGLDLKTLQQSESTAEFQPLVDILMTPQWDTPSDLIDALFILQDRRIRLVRDMV